MAKPQPDQEEQISDPRHVKISKPIIFNHLVRPELWDKSGEVKIPEIWTRYFPANDWDCVEIHSEEVGFSEIGTQYFPANDWDYMEIHSGEAKIAQPSYDMASDVIPLRNSISTMDVDPTSRMNLHHLEVVFSQVGIDVFIPLIDSTITILRVPFTTLALEKLSIYGMNYADKHWKKILMPKDDDVFQSKSEKSKKQDREGSISSLKKRGRKAKLEHPIPSFWDLLFAVLQPPLTFGQFENLLLPSAPYPYQWQGIKFLIDNEHALLADDMGTGKTVMTIVALKVLIQQAKVHHVLVLCPPSVLYEWQRHLDEWSPELTAYLIRGSQEIRKSLWQMPIHVYVTTYDTLLTFTKVG